ncbi:MAG: hypothetical protein NZ777_00640, partial [Pseudomonadales bacterium]|nr:hypothetical protein [Pseudomonadales bacterium]
MTPLASSAPYTSGESLREFAETQKFSDQKISSEEQNNMNNLLDDSNWRGDLPNEIFVVLERSGHRVCCEDTGLVGAYSDFYQALAAVKKTAEGLDVELCFSDPSIEKEKHGTFSLSDIEGEWS